MHFHETTLQDALLISPQRHGDERGYFSRVFCADTFAANGLETRFPQVNQSYNRQRGTTRGLHFQRAPDGEVKLVRAVTGAIYDVIIDLRPDSSSYLRWQGFELSAENGQMLYVPKGFAHAFQTLADDTTVTYQVSHPYTPQAEGGIRWNDPAFGIAWPMQPVVMSDKDASWPDFQPAQAYA